MGSGSRSSIALRMEGAMQWIRSPMVTKVGDSGLWPLYLTPISTTLISGTLVASSSSKDSSLTSTVVAALAAFSAAAALAAASYSLSFMYLGSWTASVG